MLLDRINFLCEKAGITIFALEKATSISVNTIRRWGTVAPSYDKVMRVAQYFGVSMDYLCGNDEADKSGSPVLELDFSKEEIRLINEYRYLSDRRKENVAEYMRSQYDLQKKDEKRTHPAAG